MPTNRAKALLTLAVAAVAATAGVTATAEPPEPEAVTIGRFDLLHPVCDPAAASCRGHDHPRTAGTAALPYWASGHQFEGRTICLESTRPLAPLATVRNDYLAATKSVVVITPETRSGGCTRRGYPVSQQIRVHSYSDGTDGWCGYASTSISGGSVRAADVYVNEHPNRAGCRTATAWPSLWEHEVGHTLGLNHVPAGENSMMPAVNNGIRVTAQVDGPRLVNLYGNNPLFGDGVR